MIPFADLGHRRQLDRLRELAREAWSHYGEPASRIRLFRHGFNSTYSVQTDSGERYALRLNVNSVHDLAGIRTELAWVRALAVETDLSVPRPRLTPDGRDHVVLSTPDFGRNVVAVAYHWLPGPDVEDRANPEIMQAMGRAIRTLHEHGAAFRLPEGCAVQTSLEPLIGIPNRLHEVPSQEVVHTVLDRAQRVIDRLAQEPPRLTHFDVHFSNVKWYRGQLTVFDFDDCLMSWPLMDIAQSLYYVRQQEPGLEWEAELWRGYGSGLEVVPEDLEALVAGRQLLLLNDLLGSNTHELRAMIPRYLEVTTQRLEHYLSTGKFNPRVARMGD